MDHEKFKEILSGYSVTTVTPFTSDLSEIDVNSIMRNITYLVKHDVPLIIPNGNTGEFYSLIDEEWSAVLTSTLESVGQRTTVMSGIGHSIKTALFQLNKAQELGAPAVMVMYPQHVFSSKEGLLAYYRAILENANGMNVVLYKKGSLLSDDVLEKLMTFDSLVGVKYAFGRIVDFSRTVHKLGHKIVWSCGTAERFAPFFHLAGAKGFTSGLCNFAPKVTKKMYDSLKAGDYSQAMEVQKMITPLENLREGRGKANNVPVVKAAMDHLGLKGGICRPPIHKLSDEEQNATVAAIAGWDI
ncbi:MAG: dihydrodipicolinate synthase family protein [Candidatus Thorarchaeota archaeon]|nr:MAG: dihydrodipicolinate synthase family protein [Candidatus Thorarchaeota archaeon]